MKPAPIAAVFALILSAAALASTGPARAEGIDRLYVIDCG